MANRRSAEKAHRVSERRRVGNRTVKSALRTFIRRARTTVASKSTDEAQTSVALATKRLDMAASKGVIHRNQAGRRKSRLMHQLAVMLRAQAQAETAPAVEAAPEVAPKARRARPRTAPAQPAATASEPASGGPARTTRRRKTSAEGEAGA